MLQAPEHLHLFPVKMFHGEDSFAASRRDTLEGRLGSLWFAKTTCGTQTDIFFNHTSGKVGIQCLYL